MKESEDSCNIMWVIDAVSIASGIASQQFHGLRSSARDRIHPSPHEHGIDFLRIFLRHNHGKLTLVYFLAVAIIYQTRCAIQLNAWVMINQLTTHHATSRTGQFQMHGIERDDVE
jgi:hypothetical protein